MMLPGEDAEDGGRQLQRAESVKMRTMISAARTPIIGQNEIIPSVEDDISSAYDSDSSSIIHLSNGMVFYLKEVDTMLALVCLMRAENFRKKSLINYNIGCLKKALMALPQSAHKISEDGL